MPTGVKSTSAKHSNAATQGASLPYPYDHLTKAEIVSMFTGHEPTKPLTQRDFTRCAIAIVVSWCHRVEKCHFACTDGVKSTLDALHHIYKNL